MAAATYTDTTRSTTTRQQRKQYRTYRGARPSALPNLATPRWNTVSREDNERLLKLWQSGANLRPAQRSYVWQWFDDFCLSRIASQMRTTWTQQRSHQRNSESKGTAQVDRILLAMEFFKVHKDRQIGWCIRAYRMRFARLETIRYLRSIGINESSVLQADSAINRRYTLLLQIVRQDYTMRGAIDVKHVLDRYRSIVTISKLGTIEAVVLQTIRLANALSVYYPVVHLDDEGDHDYDGFVQQDNTGGEYDG